jgi:hypothetical protein
MLLTRLMLPIARSRSPGRCFSLKRACEYQLGKFIHSGACGIDGHSPYDQELPLAKMVAYPLSQLLAEIPEQNSLFRAGGEPIQRDEQICGEFPQKNLLHKILMSSARRSRSFMLL